jgi:hypothetical protein
MIDAQRFVKSLLASMWMLNDLPRNMRKDLNSQLGLIWLLLSEKQCFPCLTFTEAEQRAICDQLVANSSQDGGGAEDFKFTYEALLKFDGRKVKIQPEAKDDVATAALPTESKVNVDA